MFLMNIQEETKCPTNFYFLKLFAYKEFSRVLNLKLLIERKKVSLMSSLYKILPSFKLVLIFIVSVFVI